MPLPAGYALDAPASNLPPGYTLDAPQHDFSTLTANPKGEGTYQINAPGGQKIAVPYSNVPVFIGGLQGSSFSSPEEQQRFDKDAASDPQRPTFWNALTNPIGSGAAKQGVVTGAQQVGGQAIKTIAQPIIHPIDTAGSLLKSGAYIAGTGAGVKMPESWNPVASAVQSYQNDKAQGGTALALENLGGQAIGTVEGGRMIAPVVKAAIPVVADAVSAAKSSVGDAASAVKQYVRPSPSPDIVAPEEMQAQKIAQSILPPGGIKPELVKSIQSEAPAVVEYAQRTGNPLNTQAEGLKAAQGVAQEGLDHYKTQVLEPVAGRSVVLDPQSTELGDKATIGDVDARITKLNKLINTDKANSAGAALDVLAKSKWTDEASYLRSKLYPALEHTTGIPAADIQQLREGYGGEYSLANNLESAQNARLTRTGATSQGVKTIGAPPTSIWDAPAIIYKGVKGGEQAIADRQFSSAMNGVEPQAPVRPMPPPIDTDAVAAQRASAQQEFLQQHHSEQTAQDSTSLRDQAVARFRAAQTTRYRAAQEALKGGSK